MGARGMCLLSVAAATTLTSILGSCGSDSTTAPPTDHAIVTFQVAGGETFKVELVTEDLVGHARRLLNGENVSAIPLGTVVRQDAGPNKPWTWHLDPSTVEFAFVTIEVCDGIPSDVEAGVVTSDQYCPWSAKVIALDRP